MKNDKTVMRWFPIFIIGVLLIIVYKTIDNIDQVVSIIGQFLKVVSPFLFGILICYFLYRPCKRLEEAYAGVKVKFIAKRARVLSVLSVYLIVLLLIILFVMFIVPILVTSLLDLASNIPLYYQYVLDFINNLPATTGLDISATLADFTNNTLSQLFNPALVEQLTKSVIGFANGIINILMSLIVSLYILVDRDNIANFFKKLTNTFFNEKSHKQMNKYLKQINEVLFTFIASKGLDALINWIMTTTILLVFNAKYAFLLGILAGLASFIPYLGSLIGVIFISLLTLLTSGLGTTIKVAISLIIFQQIDGNVIEPKIMGSTLKISPILVILSVILGGAYFGVMGMFLAVPITTILKQLLLEYMDSKRTQGVIVNKTKNS